MTTITTLLLLWAHLLMVGLPGAAAILLAARCGIKQVAVLLAIFLAAGGAVAMIGFWLYYAGPAIGKIFSWAALLGSLVAILDCTRHRQIDRSLLGRLATPLGLWVLGSMFVTFLGFLHGGYGHPIAVAALRYSSPQLATDNDLPQFFAS